MMKKILITVAFLSQILRGYCQGTISSILPNAMPINSVQKNGWILIFQDEFDSDTLDTQKWWAQEGTHGTELQYYRNRPENVFVKNGNLYLKALQDSFQNLPYTSGIVFSSQNFERESLVEVRCKIPKGKGLWPAFWFWRGARDSAYQELDVFEFWCDNTERFSIANHYFDKKKQGFASTYKWIQPKDKSGQKIDMSKDYFTYAAYWDKKSIKVLLNNQLVFTIKNNIPIQPFPIILNLAVDGGKGKAPNKNTVFPAEFLIDYVRVYRRNNTN